MDQATRDRFKELALPHVDSVYRVARSLASDAAEAEDLVQETFYRALRGFGTFELRDYGIRPWLLRILHNTFCTLKGRQGREPSLLDDVDFAHFEAEFEQADLDPPTAETIDWEHVDEELKQTIQGLQAEYRTVLLLWAVEGLSYKEIARVCDCALGTVMSRLYRARQLIGRALRSYARERGLSTERFD